MNRRYLIASTAAMALSLVGCAAPMLTLTVGDTTLTVERAVTAEQHEDGLKGRVDLQLREGMLFELGGRHDTSVWARGMRVPVDVVWIRDNAVVQVDQLDLCDWKAPTSCPKLVSPGPVDAVLEVNRGALPSARPGTLVREGSGAR